MKALRRRPAVALADADGQRRRWDDGPLRRRQPASAAVELAARSLTIERYGAGAIPSGSTLVDWPVGYDHLEPYYDVVEKAIGVGGTDGANPFEGSRFSPYPMPPLRRSGWNRLMHDSAQSLGWHPYAAPTALNSEPYNGNPECTYCGFCASNGCYRNAKGRPTSP